MLKTVGNPSTRSGDQTILDGNLVIGTSGKGVDFSATPGTGTSELFDDYEEGTWTVTDASGAGLTLVTNNTATYTKIGRMVYASFDVTYPTTADGSTQIFGGLPFMATNQGTICIGFTDQGGALYGQTGLNDSIFVLYNSAGVNLTNSQMSAKRIRATVVYQSS